MFQECMLLHCGLDVDTVSFSTEVFLRRGQESQTDVIPFTVTPGYTGTSLTNRDARLELRYERLQVVMEIPNIAVNMDWNGLAYWRLQLALVSLEDM